MNARAQLPDLSHLWMPFTANKQFKAQPRLLPAPGHVPRPTAARFWTAPRACGA